MFENKNKINKSHFYLNLDFIQSVLKEGLHCEYIRPFHFSLSPQVSSSYVTLTDSSSFQQDKRSHQHQREKHTHVTCLGINQTHHCQKTARAFIIVKSTETEWKQLSLHVICWVFLVLFCFVFLLTTGVS